MSETAVKKEKKKWSTGKKVAVILCSVLLALILIVVSGGLIYLHNYCQVKDYTVTAMGNHDVTLIAHRGFRAVAPENTLPAFEEAGKAGFTGAECDTYRTKDGVWVISHDSHTYRMMDQHAFVEKKTYDELRTYNTDNGVNIDQYPNLKICTLEDYLKTCVQYNMTAVIELKGKNNTEHYDEIMKLVADTGAKPLFISFHLENLQQIRKLSQDVPVWYLVQKIDDQAIADAKAFCDSKGIQYIEKNGTTTAEVQMAAEALIAAGVKAVFTPTDTTVMTAELSIYETFTEAGVQHYTGADSFALNGAFVGYGVDYVQLGEATADMVVELLCEGKTTADLPYQTFDNGIATINTETCEALGLDLDTVKKAFAPYCTEVVEVTTAENFN